MKELEQKLASYLRSVSWVLFSIGVTVLWLTGHTAEVVVQQVGAAVAVVCITFGLASVVAVSMSGLGKVKK